MDMPKPTIELHDLIKFSIALLVSVASGAFVIGTTLQSINDKNKHQDEYIKKLEVDHNASINIINTLRIEIEKHKAKNGHD